jgi:ERI1 exoribonuclease 3
LKVDPTTGEALNFIFLTCGDWDLKSMLPAQTSYFNLTYPRYLKQWINVKKAYATFKNRKSQPKGMTCMLDELQLPLIGRHHSGIGKNIQIPSH